MFHKAIHLEYKEDTCLELSFQDGRVVSYDIANLFEKYPQMRALEDRALFCAGTLTGYGIIWNDDLDLETETIYEEGTIVRVQSEAPNILVGKAVLAARARSEMSQKELAAVTGIDQSDISKIERGTANPSVNTLARIAKALGCSLLISMEQQTGQESTRMSETVK